MSAIFASMMSGMGGGMGLATAGGSLLSGLGQFFGGQRIAGAERQAQQTIQDMLRWADPSILLKVYAHSRMDKRMEAQGKMIEAMGLSHRRLVMSPTGQR